MLCKPCYVNWTMSTALCRPSYVTRVMLTPLCKPCYVNQNAALCKPYYEELRFNALASCNATSLPSYLTPQLSRCRATTVKRCDPGAAIRRFARFKSLK